MLDFFYLEFSDPLKVDELKKYNKENPNDKNWGYYDWRFEKLYPDFKSKYDNQQLALKGRDEWKKFDVPKWSGLSH